MIPRGSQSTIARSSALSRRRLLQLAGISSALLPRLGTSTAITAKPSVPARHFSLPDQAQQNRLQTTMTGISVRRNDNKYQATNGSRTIASGSDAATVVQTALDIAGSDAGPDGGGGGYVFLEPAFYDISSQLVVPPFVDFSCLNGASLYNALSDPYEPCLHFRQNSSSEYIELNADGNSGILVGTPDAQNEIWLDTIDITNVGKNYDDATDRAQVGVRFRGYNTAFNHIHCYQGNRCIEFDTASDIYGHSVLVVGGAVGIRAATAEHIYLGSVDVDSCDLVGIELNDTNDFTINGGSVWRTGPDSNGLRYGTSIGEYAECSVIELSLKYIGHGGTALFVDRAANSYLTAHVSNAELKAETTSIKTGIKTTNRTADSTYFFGTVDDVDTRIKKNGGTFSLTTQGWDLDDFF